MINVVESEFLRLTETILTGILPLAITENPAGAFGGAAIFLLKEISIYWFVMTLAEYTCGGEPAGESLSEVIP